MCHETNFGVKVNNGEILCAQYSEMEPTITTNGELRMFYMFNNCCAGIIFETINFNKNGTSDIIITRFGTPDGKINIAGSPLKTANGKITVNKIKKGALSANFTASFKDDKGNNVSLEGNFKDIIIKDL